MLHLLSLLLLSVVPRYTASSLNVNVLVYGSTPGGVISAVSASRAGADTVILLDPAMIVGGMSSNGLGQTDKGITFAIGGYANEFFVRVARFYNSSTDTPLYQLEPHLAEKAFMDMLNEDQILRIPTTHITNVLVQNQQIISVTTAEGTTITADMFIDATYEGDLLALAGATMTWGREAQSVYKESYAGRREPYSAMDYFPVSPYLNNNTGELYPFLVTDAYAAPFGSGDDKVQGYNFRLCVTKNVSNKVPFTQPANYNSSDWALLRAYAALAPATLPSYLNNIAPLPNGKYDLNNGGLISTDATGLSWLWPNATYEERQSIYQAHIDYQQGFLWTVGNDPAIPITVRNEVNSYGLCKDEFTMNNNWPPQLYVREGRRLVGDNVFIQQNIENRTSYGNLSIGLGSYAFDGHYSHRGPCIMTTNHSCVMWTEPTPPTDLSNIGFGGEGYPGPQTELYQIPYTVLLPQRKELQNILAVTTPSTSHVAFCSIRMEPQFMILGQAAGDAVMLALTNKVPVQDIDVNLLHAQLMKEGAVLCHQEYPNC